MKERAGGKFPHLIKEIVRERQGGRCAVCNGQDHLTVHHIQPKSRKGTNGIDNAVGACESCHKLLDELILEHSISYRQIAMEPGVEYEVGLRNLVPEMFHQSMESEAIAEQPAHLSDLRYPKLSR